MLFRYGGQKKATNLSSDQSGFTLVELLVTVLVSVVLIGGLSIIVNNNVFLTERGRDMVISNSYAENKIEELRSQGYLALTNGTTDVTSELPDELNTPRSASVIVTDVSTGLKLVNLTITYNEQGRSITQDYKTYIGELGVGQY